MTTERTLEKPINSWGAGTDVDGNVTLDWSFSRQVVQYLVSVHAIEFCWKDLGQHYKNAQILLEY